MRGRHRITNQTWSLRPTARDFRDGIFIRHGAARLEYRYQPKPLQIVADEVFEAFSQ